MNIDKTASVAEYLRANGSITSWEAIQMFKATRLSSIIFRLKERGWPIVSTWEENDGARYVRYVLEGKR